MQAQGTGVSVSDRTFLSRRQGAYSTTCGNGTVNLLPIKILVLDEADRMLDMGFAPAD